MNFEAMGASILKLNQQNNALTVLGLFSLVLLIGDVCATEFKVGGDEGWKVPSDPNAHPYNQWAEKNRFRIGNSLLFVYSSSDSVLYVSKEAYANCDTSTFIEKFSDGHTVFKFNQSGPFHFISGSKENCLKNEKLVVVVLGDRAKANSPPPPAPPVSPPPPPPSDSTDDMVPSPAPSGEVAPSTPSDQSPPKNGASSVFVGIIGSFGAFFGSLLLLVI